jgi:hypothetical protein
MHSGEIAQVNHGASGMAFPQISRNHDVKKLKWKKANAENEIRSHG